LRVSMHSIRQYNNYPGCKAYPWLRCILLFPPGCYRWSTCLCRRYTPPLTVSRNRNDAGGGDRFQVKCRCSEAHYGRRFPGRNQVQDKRRKTSDEWVNPNVRIHLEVELSELPKKIWRSDQQPPERATSLASARVLLGFWHFPDGSNAASQHLCLTINLHRSLY
jgi:hypothetical protein